MLTFLGKKPIKSTHGKLQSVLISSIYQESTLCHYIGCPIKLYGWGLIKNLLF
jgi:hypothetical protein